MLSLVAASGPAAAARLTIAPVLALFCLDVTHKAVALQATKGSIMHPVSNFLNRIKQFSCVWSKNTVSKAFGQQLLCRMLLW
jgi:hypothetical protein